MNKICHLCGNEILPTDNDTDYMGTKVHLDCVHDIMHPEEENERL